MYIFGGSGHCKVIIDIIKESKLRLIKGVFDDNPKSESILDIPVSKTKNHNFFVDKHLIVAIGDNKIRKKNVQKIEALYITAIHPKAVISNDVKIEEGTVIMAGVIINSSVIVGKHCIINTAAVVDHDCVLNDFVHISPNASLAGNVLVGEGTHVGIGSIILQGIKIGKWATIGAGAVIINDVPDYAVLVGNPGKIIKYNLQDND